MASAFGSRLRRFREAKKLTLQQVADAVGCTKAYIWELEMKEGQRPPPSACRRWPGCWASRWKTSWVSPSPGSRGQSRGRGLLPRVRRDDGGGEETLPAGARDHVPDKGQGGD
ncbi:helix-turn-helix domain-containing protein [Aerosticca soli]|uniref:helix-turn-helix domain-containing protein n=1 Tax=Aerosticca soli TaxID=2010829 RepID=UPI0018E0845C